MKATDLRSCLLDWMRGGKGDFAGLSLEVFRHQFGNNIPYRNYCLSLGKSPENLSSWHDIPALPTDVFKLPGIALRCFPEEETIGHFLTSGTTREVKGKHEFRDLELYEAAVLGGVEAISGRRPIFGKHEVFFFSQRAEDAPHSSLVRMFEILGGRAVPPGGFWLIDREGKLLPENFQPQTPCAILGTSIALLKACDEIPPLPLPEGSWIFETGGSKGLEKSFTPAEVRVDVVSEAAVVDQVPLHGPRRVVGRGGVVLPLYPPGRLPDDLRRARRELQELPLHGRRVGGAGGLELLLGRLRDHQ